MNAPFKITVDGKTVHEGNNYMVAVTAYSRHAKASADKTIVLYHNGKIKRSRIGFVHTIRL